MHLKESLMEMSGFWFCKRKNIPVGCDYISDLKYNIRLPLNTVFDVGANIGQTASIFHHHFKQARIYSFEPVTNTFDRLIENTKKMDRVSCFKIALGDKIDSIEVDLFDDEYSYLNSLKKEAMNKNAMLKETLQIVRGDVFCEKNDISEVDLLKIDTEGYELEVLYGFEEMIRGSKIKTIYCEVGLNPEDDRHTFINDLIHFATHNGFRFYGLYEVDNCHVKDGTNFGNLLFISNRL